MPTEQLAPIVLFVYNRPQHAAMTLKSLMENPLAKNSLLYVFADGPKPGATAEEKNKINETRALFRDLSGFKGIVLTEKEENEGLAASVIAGVTEIVHLHGTVIVLEDDLVVSPCFLEFMNEALLRYKDAANVYSVTGFMFPVESALEKTVLLPYISTWGWATWRSKWEAMDTTMPDKALIKQNPFLLSRFNLADYDYAGMLDLQNRSWGIKWYYSIFIRNGLSVFPTRSLVSNIGFDGSGENCIADESEVALPQQRPLKVSSETTIDLQFYNSFLNYFSNSKNERNKFKRFLNLFR